MANHVESQHRLDGQRPMTRSMASKDPAGSKSRLFPNTKRPKPRSIASKGRAGGKSRHFLGAKGPKTRRMASMGPAGSQSQLPVDTKGPTSTKSRLPLNRKEVKTRSRTSKGPAGNQRPPFRPKPNVVLRSRRGITSDLLLMAKGPRKRGSQEVSKRPIQVARKSHAPSTKHEKVKAKAGSAKKSGVAAGPVTRIKSQSTVKTGAHASKTGSRRSNRVIQPKASYQPVAASQTPRSKVRIPSNPGVATGRLIQYVVKMIDDSEPMYDPKFEAQTKANIARGDYRYMTPCGTETDERDRATVNRALEMTRIDFFERKGEVVQEDLKIEHHNESYASQHRRIQEIFDRKWGGLRPAPKLYCLPKWTGAFKDWEALVRDNRGKELQCMMKKWEDDGKEMELIPAYWE